MKMRYFLLAFIGLVTFWAVLSVGEPIQCNEGVYTWMVPLTMFALVTFPSFLAYYAGKADAMDDFSEGRF